MSGLTSALLRGRTRIAGVSLSPPSSRSTSSAATIAMNCEDDAMSFRRASPVEKTTARSRYPWAANSSVSKRQQRNASASSFESAPMISGFDRSPCHQFLSVPLWFAMEGRTMTWATPAQ